METAAADGNPLTTRIPRAAWKAQNAFHSSPKAHHKVHFFEGQRSTLKTLFCGPKDGEHFSGLWLDDEITVHGPHDSSGTMWGDASARIDGGEQQWAPEYAFRAVANRSKHRPARIRIWDKDDKEQAFPLLKTSDLTPRAQRWLRVARRMLKKKRASDWELKEKTP